MKTLITGATGFIGSHLVEALAQRNAEVFALVRDPGRLKLPPGRSVQVLKGDLFSVPELPAGLTSVIHLAGLTKSLKSENYYTVNQKGTASLFDALGHLRPAPKIVHLSSLSAAGPSAAGHARSENDPPEPVTPYGRSKLLGEEEALARKDRFRLVILRVGAVFGPRDTDMLNLFRYIKRGIVPAIGFKARSISVCYVKDLVRALILAAEVDLATGEILNVGDPVPRTLTDLGKAAGRLMGKRPTKIVIPLRLAYAGVFASEFLGRLARKPTILNRDKYREYKQPGWVADVSKARAVLGFETRYSLEDGLRETIAWYQENGWL